MIRIGCLSVALAQVGSILVRGCFAMSMGSDGFQKVKIQRQEGEIVGEELKGEEGKKQKTQVEEGLL